MLKASLHKWTANIYKNEIYLKRGLSLKAVGKLKVWVEIFSFDCFIFTKLIKKYLRIQYSYTYSF